MQETHLKQQQSQLLAFIFALCSNNPDERLVGELGAFQLMKEFDEYTLNLAVDFYSALKIKTEAYTQGAH